MSDEDASKKQSAEGSDEDASKKQSAEDSDEEIQILRKGCINIEDENDDDETCYEQEYGSDEELVFKEQPRATGRMHNRDQDLFANDTHEDEGDENQVEDNDRGI